MASPLGLSYKYSKSLNDWDMDAKSLKQYSIVNGHVYKSLFDNGTFTPYPNMLNKKGDATGGRAISDLNSDDSNDTSVDSLIKYTANYPAMKLTSADFYYLKDIGVYPNNRLIIARRFQSGVINDLTSLNVNPMATLISWAKEDTDYITFKYGEEWTESEATFKEILNSIGADIKLSAEQGSNLGDAAYSGFGLLPFPGLMEGLQLEVLKNMGLSDYGAGQSPLGDPNLIRTSKRRKILDKDSASSGLKCSFSVKFTVEYTQKYINDNDPTIVYLDIIQNALTFGTSESRFTFTNLYKEGAESIVNDLMKGDVAAIGKALTKFIEALTKAIAEIGSKIIDALINPPKVTPGTTPSSDKVKGFITDFLTKTLTTVISKYRVKLLGVINSLTGSPSAPWHVTIGNPKKPMISSGDMICDEVELTVGKNLSYNDLPSYIKLDFTLTNARPLGAQEILDRFNTGKGRNYARTKLSYVESSESDDDIKSPLNTSPNPTVQTSGPTSNENSIPSTNTNSIPFNSGSGPISNPNTNSGNPPINVSNAQRDTNNQFVTPTNPNNSTPSNQSASTIPGSSVPIPNSNNSNNSKDPNNPNTPITDPSTATTPQLENRLDNINSNLNDPNNKKNFTQDTQVNKSDGTTRTVTTSTPEYNGLVKEKMSIMGELKNRNTA